VGPRASLVVVAKRKILHYSYQESYSGHLSCSLVTKLNELYWFLKISSVEVEKDNLGGFHI